MRPPLTMGWKYAWKVLPSWRCLHRVATHDGWDNPTEEENWGDIQHHGTTCCGQTGLLMMPGLFSRLSLRRCRKCAKAAGVDPDTPGIPGNGTGCGPVDAWQTRNETA